MSDEILDLPEFLDRVQDDKELLLELLDIFTGDFQEKRKSLIVAVEGSDFEQIASIAHSLKGASGNISAKQLRELFLKLEDMGRNNVIDGAKELLGQVDQEFAKLEERIKTVRQEFGEG